MLQRRNLPVEEPRGNQQDAYSAAQRDARSQKEGPLVARGGGGSRVPARRREERRQVRSLRHGHARRVGWSRESRGRPPSRQRFGCRCFNFFFGFWITPNISAEISPPPNTLNSPRLQTWTSFLDLGAAGDCEQSIVELNGKSKARSRNTRSLGGGRNTHCQTFGSPTSRLKRLAFRHFSSRILHHHATHNPVEHL